MSNWGHNTADTDLRLAINSLYQRNQIPRSPSENVPLSSPATEHRMIFEREKQITSNLAFLSATTDNNLKVMAVCIEEHNDKEGITIRLASNTGDLSDIKAGFELLAKTLEQAARRVNIRADDNKAVFRQIIKLDSRRILSRLRSRHAKKSRKTHGRTPAINLLWDALNAVSRLTNPNLQEAQSRVLRLKKSFEELEKIPDFFKEIARGEAILEEMTEQAHEFTQVIDLTKLLHPTTDPSLKEYLPVAVGKLGRYYSASCELVSAARDRSCRIFSKIIIAPFQIQVPASFQHSELKIHAEIQLLFFYELHPEYPRPRVICSSKSACFLCNLFFDLHGVYHIPRSHGRLYHKWVLPTWLNIPNGGHAKLSQIISRMISILDKEIVKAQKVRRPSYNHPNESVLLPRAHWTPSVLSARLSSHNSASTVRLVLPEAKDQIPRTLSPTYSEMQLRKQELSPVISSHTSSSRILAPTAVPTSSISITYKSLPYTQSVTLQSSLLHLEIEKVSITFEFVAVSSGQLSIAQANGDSNTDQDSAFISIQDIPTTTEMKRVCSGDSDRVSFILRYGGYGMICIEFLWLNS